MSRAVLFRVREYLKGSLWYGPVAGAILGPLLAVLTHQADTSLTVPKAWQRTWDHYLTLAVTVDQAQAHARHEQGIGGPAAATTAASREHQLTGR